MPAPVDTTDRNSAEATAAADKERKRAMLAGGMKSTILTSSMGDTTPATTKKATLLGGV